MTVNELIKRLGKLRGDMQVMVLDSHNGGGNPRELNLGPTTHAITLSDVEEAADCEEMKIGDEVVVLGYGCY